LEVSFICNSNIVMMEQTWCKSYKIWY
jgi:hypothetical protein